MNQHLPQMGGCARPYSLIGLAGVSILSGCHYSGVAPAVFPLALSTLYQVMPLELTVTPGGVVRWLHHYTDPYATTMSPNYTSSTLMSSWIVPIPSAHGTQWYYHARFRGCGHDAQPLFAALAGIIAIPPSDPAASAMEESRTMIHWEHDRPRNDFVLPALDEALSGSWSAANDAPGFINIWRVPSTAETGTKCGYYCRFHDATDSGRIVDMRIEGVVLVEYLAADFPAAAEQGDRHCAVMARMAS